MPIETATTISGLDSSWPLATDGVSEGDDHLRLLKSVLKNQFPGASGTGLTAPVTVTAAEFNTLDGINISVSLQQQIDGVWNSPIDLSGVSIDNFSDTCMVYSNNELKRGDRFTKVTAFLLLEERVRALEQGG